MHGPAKERTMHIATERDARTPHAIQGGRLMDLHGGMQN